MAAESTITRGRNDAVPGWTGKAASLDFASRLGSAPYHVGLKGLANIALGSALGTRGRIQRQALKGRSKRRMKL